MATHNAEDGLRGVVSRLGTLKEAAVSVIDFIDRMNDAYVEDFDAEADAPVQCIQDSQDQQVLPIVERHLTRAVIAVDRRLRPDAYTDNEWVEVVPDPIDDWAFVSITVS